MPPYPPGENETAVNVNGRPLSLFGANILNFTVRGKFSCLGMDASIIIPQLSLFVNICHCTANVFPKLLTCADSVIIKAF